jgi:acetyltransferase-like isoleucine patch superfamily enzyme
MRIGNNVRITGYSYIAAATGIDIGDNVLIAEYCSVRDHEHATRKGDLIREQPLRMEQVIIGGDCWICRGASVLKGSILGGGSVGAANAVVKGRVLDNQIVGGAPAKPLKSRV